MFVLKTEQTLILATSYNISNQAFLNNDFSLFKFISGIFVENNQCSLMFANMEKKIFFFLNPNEESDKNQKCVFDTWTLVVLISTQNIRFYP